MRHSGTLQTWRDIPPDEQAAIGNAAIGVGNAVAKTNPHALRQALRDYPLLFERLAALMATALDPRS